MNLSAAGISYAWDQGSLLPDSLKEIARAAARQQLGLNEDLKAKKCQEWLIITQPCDLHSEITDGLLHKKFFEVIPGEKSKMLPPLLQRGQDPSLMN